MTFRTITLQTLILIFILAGAVLVYGGLLILPDNMPANALASWLHPGTLTVLSGFLSWLCVAICMALLGSGEGSQRSRTTHR